MRAQLVVCRKYCFVDLLSSISLYVYKLWHLSFLHLSNVLNQDGGQWRLASKNSHAGVL
jgi:hypothetical protein